MGYAEALEQQLAETRELERQWENLTPDEWKNARPTLEALRLAAPYYVSGPVAALLAAAARTLPEATWRDEDLPEPCGWVYLAEAQPLPLGGGRPRREAPGELGTTPATLQAISWGRGRYTDGGRGFSLALYGPPRTDIGWRAPDLFVTGGVSFGEAVGTTRSLGEWRAISAYCEAFLYTLWRFVRQRLLVAGDRPVLNRGARKRLAKRWEHAPLVRVVELRRREYARRDPATPRPVDWSCQWLVRGHWRRHYYPASAEHRPLWIFPHVKGPPGQPLKAPTLTVFEVDR